MLIQRLDCNFHFSELLAVRHYIMKSLSNISDHLAAGGVKDLWSEIYTPSEVVFSAIRTVRKRANFIVEFPRYRW